MNEHPPRPAAHHGKLLADIRRIEARLAELDGGDCAYEKALVRSYEQAVAEARARLADLPGR